MIKLIQSNPIVVLFTAVFFCGLLHLGSCQSPSVSSHAASGGVSVAYFLMDSLELNYDYVLSVKRTFEAKQTAAQEELVLLERKYQKKLKSYQSSLSKMTKAQAESAQKEFYELQQKFQEKQMQFQQKLIKDQGEFATKIQQVVEDYISQHKDKYPYDFVIAAQPGVVFYKNPRYDITSELIRDLNTEYKK